MPAALLGTVELVVELLALLLFVRQQEFVVTALVVSEHALQHSQIDLDCADHVAAHDHGHPHQYAFDSAQRLWHHRPFDVPGELTARLGDPPY